TVSIERAAAEKLPALATARNVRMLSSTSIVSRSRNFASPTFVYRESCLLNSMLFPESAEPLVWRMRRADAAPLRLHEGGVAWPVRRAQRPSLFAAAAMAG